ncbi:MAG: hypothetical protein EP332_06070 [Bacteroidetes bacterium]|nr:MAG: hypothetical protein EP332_06070 [Bacteroidota bacterium]
MAQASTFNLNGTFYSTDQIMSAYNRGLHFGDSVFESILVINGMVQLWEQHYARLLQGAATLGFDFQPWWTEDYFKFEIRKSVKENKLSSARVKLSLFREDGTRYTPNTDKASYLIMMESLESEPYALKPEGLQAGIFEDILKPINALSGFKNGNSLLYVLAGRKARNEAWGTILLLNEKGQVCESGNGNVFLFRDGVVSTPSIESGCVAGVMRLHLIQLMQQAGWKVEEREIPKSELDMADEIWTCNASGGIQYVNTCGLRQYKNEKVLELHQLLISQIQTL